MENDRYLEEEEIDLMECFNVLLKRKRQILSVFLITVVAAAILSFLLPRRYLATASIMITPSRIQSVLSPTAVTLDVDKAEPRGEYITPRPAISIPTHETLLSSNFVLGSVIQKINLKDSRGKDINVQDLSRQINISRAKETNVLQLGVTDTDPQQAAAIANAWAQKYVEYSQELVLGEVTGTGDFIFDQFEIARKNLLQAEEVVKDFKLKYKLDLMEVELGIKKTNYNDYKKELAGMELALKTKQDTLAELNQQIANQEKFIIVSKAITDDALWSSVLAGSKRAHLDKQSLRSEVINPIYENLETRIVDTRIAINTLKPKVEHLTELIGALNKEIIELENTIIQKKFDLQQLNREVDIYKRTYDTLAARIEEARIIKAAQLGEVRVVSAAIAPRYPAGWGKRQKVAIAGILGLMLGVFFAFFTECRQKGKPQTQKTQSKPNKHKGG